MADNRTLYLLLLAGLLTPSAYCQRGVLGARAPIAAMDGSLARPMRLNLSYHPASTSALKG